MARTTNPRCPLCYGRGGSYIPKLGGGTKWVKCVQCFPKQTRSQARDQALHRYLTGNRNVLAYAACLRLGYSEVSLAAEVLAYDTAHGKPLTLEDDHAA